MTEQEIFDKVLAHLRAQGSAARRGTACAYRGYDGKMCAVGCLIPDELYDPAIEGVGVFPDQLQQEVARSGDKLLAKILDASGLARETWTLLSDLQDAHDKYLDGFGLAAWETEMEIIATRFGLKYSEPDRG